MHFEVLSHDRQHRCSIELVKSDLIEIKRRPNQVFHFKEVSNFVNVLTGHSSCIVHQGKDSTDADQWKAYYWEATFDQARKDYGTTGNHLLPYGSLAILELEDEYGLQWELERLTKEARQWLDLFGEISNLARKIRNIDDESEYADSDRFRYMGIDELEKVLEEIKGQYDGLTSTKKAEV